MNTLERLQGMVNKPYLYRNEEVVVLGYCEGTGDDGDEVEIYLNISPPFQILLFYSLPFLLMLIESHNLHLFSPT